MDGHNPNTFMGALQFGGQNVMDPNPAIPLRSKLRCRWTYALSPRLMDSAGRPPGQVSSGCMAVKKTGDPK